MLNIPLIVNAKLRENLVYTSFDGIVTIFAGSKILVDIDQMIALIDDDHLDIDMEEIEILNPN